MASAAERLLHRFFISLGVLLASRTAWLFSVLLSGVCIVQVGRTYLPTRREVRDADEQIAKADEAYGRLRKAHVGANEDEKAIEQFDPDSKIRLARQARMNPAQPETSGPKDKLEAAKQ